MGSKTNADPVANPPVVLTINKKKYTLEPHVQHDTSLNVFLRDHMFLRGTKVMCREGGCGACVVSVTLSDSVTGKKKTFAVNSCLVLVHTCHEWEITTVEGVGSKKTGYHTIQKRLANFNGTQCGYCSPGMVMNMYSLMAGKKVTMEEVENSFGGNICRCTGYRPILDAFKSLASDASPELLQKCEDIEDLHNHACPQTGKPCAWQCINGQSEPDMPNCENDESSLFVSQINSTWYRVNSMNEIYQIFSSLPDNNYMLVSGNTATGVYRRTVELSTYIDITRVKELHSYSVSDVIKLGANISLTETMDIFQTIAKQRSQFSYVALLAKHIDLIANVPVRNTGTLAGNLSIKHQYHEFPSDIFLILETVGAKLLIGSSVQSVQAVSLPVYLNMDMTKKVIHAIQLPPLTTSHFLRTFKIMLRAQNAHAFVNAGFLFKLNKSNKGKLMEKPSIVYGGINPQFIHALGTESYLQDKQLFDVKVVQGALERLNAELQPDYVLPDTSPQYRKGLAQALFYKFVLGLKPPGLNPLYASGGDSFKRPLSSGKQTFPTDPKEWPLTKPIHKLEGLIQCSGEAEYIDDIPRIKGECFAAFVLTTVGPATISKIDSSAALAVPGVITFMGVNDIPGENTFTTFSPPLYNISYNEEIFCSGKVLYAGQSVGIVVAETQELAEKGASLVKLEYTNIQKPVITIDDAIQSGDPNRIKTEVPPQSSEVKVPNAATHTFKGKFKLGGQYHYTMETLTCLVVPTEDGLDVFPASQWVDSIQHALSVCLPLPQNNINLKVRRIGGGYGIKITRTTLVAAACALAAMKLNRPVHLRMPLEHNMEAFGTRFPCQVEYEVGMDDNGKIVSMNSVLYQNSGSSLNDTVLNDFTIPSFPNCYDNTGWIYQGKAALTDVASNTYMRGPGTLEGMTFIEVIMEHGSCVMKKDPLEVRDVNMDKTDPNIPDMIKDILKTSSYNTRKQAVTAFNKANRWKKQGIALLPMNFRMIYFSLYNAFVAIYHEDGTVSISHGGVECGQGINTKAAQTCARFLKIPVEMVKVKAMNNITAPNGQMTGASITSEAVCYAVMKCCEEINNRLAPIKEGMSNLSWVELTREAYKKNVDLTGSYMFTSDDAKAYSSYGVCVAQVEVDILTGEHQVLKVNILEDAGKSLNPEVDLGQVEGAFVTGLGLFFSEQLIHDPKTGRLLTNRTWNYKPPGAKDIPINFSVDLRQNAPNPYGVLRSKATGEPGLCLSLAAFFAARNALQSARKDAGNTDVWFTFDSPATPENMFLTSLTDPKQFLL